MKNPITFTSAPYFRSHMKQPRGYGLWAFEADFGETSVMIWTPASMAYADAKKYARAEALKIAGANFWSGSIEIAAQP